MINKIENSSLVKISELLSDGQYHDGTSIGKKCGITRAAVWKIIKKVCLQPKRGERD